MHANDVEANSDEAPAMTIPREEPRTARAGPKPGTGGLVAPRLRRRGCARCRALRQRLARFAGRRLPLVLSVALVGLFAAFGAMRPLLWHRMIGWGLAFLLGAFALRALTALPRLWLTTPFTIGETRRRNEALLAHALALHLGIATLAATLSGQNLYAEGRRWSDFSLALHAACANWALLAAALLAGGALLGRVPGRTIGGRAAPPVTTASSAPRHRPGVRVRRRGCPDCPDSERAE